MNGIADLHRHLDGSLRESTLQELAEGLGVPPHPSVRFEPGMGLDAALARFQYTLSLLQTPDSVRRVAHEICEDAAAEGVTTLEIRFAPQLHHGSPIPEIVDAALDGIDGRAGLILCVLYGEEPSVASTLVDVAGPRSGVVGIDLAGGPAPQHRWTMRDYAPAFQRAKKTGLGRTVHAAEGRDPEEIITAITQLHAQRIGHGTTLLQSSRALDCVLQHETIIEACPTSNWHTGVISSIEDHPLPQWLAAGVRVCINTDNTLLSDIDATTEYTNVRRLDAISGGDMARLTATGHRAAFERS